MDLASLAFQIDSSDTLKAVQALDQLRQTTQATTQANQDFTTQGDFLVTSMSSQGAGAARLSRQLGEIGDRFGDLMTAAEKARQAFDGSAASFDTWDIAQNKVEALGRAYGTTARGLDAYLQTANQLQMSSTQAAASVQRLTMALENQGAAAANIRQILSNNGVSINDLQTDQIDTLLTRIKGAFQDRPDSQQRTQDLRSILGTFDPDVIGTFTNTNYVPIQEQRAIQRRTATDLDVSRENSANRSLLREQRISDQKLDDYQSTFGEAQLFGLPLGYSHWRPDGYVSAQDLATMRAAASPDSAFARDGTSSDAGRLAFYEQVLGTDISGDRSKFTPEQRIAAQVRDRADATWMPRNTRNWMRYLDSGKVGANEIDIQRRRNDELDNATSFWQRPGINATAWGREIENFFGAYTPTAKPPPAATALDQDGTGAALSALGDNRIQRFQAATSLEKSLGVYQGVTGGDTLKDAGDREKAARATFVGAYGAVDGEQNFRAARARAADSAQRAYLDDGAVQDARVAEGLSRMSEADSAQAKGFIAYARERGVPASALAGESLSDLMDPTKSAGGNLPAGLLDTFKRQRDISVAANTNEFDRSMSTDMGDLHEQAGVAGTGSANLQDLITYQQAYRKALAETNDTAEASRRANAELTKAEADRVVQIKASTGALEEQNREAAAYNDTMAAGPTAAGADRSAASMLAAIQQQVDQQRFDKKGAFGQDQEQQFVAAKKADLGNSGVKDAQDQAAAAEQELKTQQRLLDVAGDRAGVQSKLSRDIQVEMSFQKDLASAQASGDQKRIDQVTDLIEHTKRLKDAIAEVNLEAKAFKIGSDARTNIQESIERMKLRPEDRGLYDAQRPVRELQRESQSSAGAAGGEIAAGDMNATQRAFLRTIGGPESGGRYDVRYTAAGPAAFDDYSRHPDKQEPTPSGDISTAAGRYQINNPTWQDLQKKYGFGDYQPATQDHAAWSLAVDRYKAATKGGDLEADLADPSKMAGIASALKPTWVTANPATFGDSFARNLHDEPGSTAMPNRGQNATAIGDAAGAIREQHQQEGAAAIQELGEKNARSQRDFDTSLPFVRRGDQVGAAEAHAGQVNDADPRGIDVAQAEARQKQIDLEREYARQLEATKAATDITIDSNERMAGAYSESTSAVQKLQDQMKVEAEARTTKMSDLDKTNRLIQLNTQRMTEQTAATEQQAKSMRDSSADQKAINDLGPMASETAIGRKQAEVDIDRFKERNPGASDQSVSDYADARRGKEAVDETTRSIQEYKSAWEGAQSAGFSALNEVITTGGRAQGVVSGLVRSLAQIGLNSIEKSAGNFLSDFIGGAIGIGGAAAAGSAASTGMGLSAGMGGLYAQGGAFVAGRPVRTFAVGGLIDRPTHFYSAGGETNLAGEMGTEAILPLKRMPNGDLGVSTGSGGSSGGGVTVHAPITIQGNGNGGGGSSGLTPAQMVKLQS